MKVAKKPMPDGHHSWTVIDQGKQAINPVDRYLDYLYHLQKSPNTLRAYAYHLMHFWQYLTAKQLLWSTVSLEQLAGFITWLRSPPSLNTIVLHQSASRRAESSINAALAAVTSFYKFQQQRGENPEIKLYQNQHSVGSKYKPFLHHLSSTTLKKSRTLKIKVPQIIPKILTQSEVEQVIELCNYRRDKFLVYLLYDTGMRIGQALGLYHQDIKSFDNEIHIIPRDHHVNGARAKTHCANVIPVSQQLMRLYSDYTINEVNEAISCPYMFVALKGPSKGRPLRYTAIQDLFKRFSKGLGRHITPHMLRHTHATNLINAGWDMALIKQRLGHQSVQTTINNYIHFTTKDMKLAFKQYEEKRNGEKQ